MWSSTCRNGPCAHGLASKQTKNFQIKYFKRQVLAGVLCYPGDRAYIVQSAKFWGCWGGWGWISGTRQAAEASCCCGGRALNASCLACREVVNVRGKRGSGGEGALGAEFVEGLGSLRGFGGGGGGKSPRVVGGVAARRRARSTRSHPLPRALKLGACKIATRVPVQFPCLGERLTSMMRDFSRSKGASETMKKSFVIRFESETACVRVCRTPRNAQQ